MRALPLFYLLGTMIAFCGAEPAAVEEKSAPAESITVEQADKIQANLDKEVSIIGTPNAKSTIAKSGHMFLNFDQSNFVVFCFNASVAKFPDDKKPAALIGKKIKVTGKLTLYKEKPQMAIRTPEQIEILPAEAPANPTPEPAEKPAPSDKKEEKKVVE